MIVKTRTGEVELGFYGFAAEKIYEDRNNKALDLSKPMATTIIELFYCFTIAQLKLKKRDILTFEDWFDDIYNLNEGDLTITKFYQWYIEQKIAENKLINDMVNKKEESKKNQ